MTLQLRTFKTQVTTNTRPLVYHLLYSSVAELLGRTACPREPLKMAGRSAR